MDLVSVDGDGVVQQLPDTALPAISDTGGVVAYDIAVPVPESAASLGSAPTRRVWIRDRVAGASRPVAEARSAAPGISGNGCVVAYSALRDAAVVLTVVDRCAAPIDSPLPVGVVVDTLDGALEAGAGTGLSAPALSFDGSTIVWSTGNEIRRYARPTAGGDHERTHSFDAVPDGSPEVVTGADLDLSADGGTAVFVAGPAGAPYAPAPANVYVWSLSTADTDPEAISTTPSGTLGSADSMSPTISGDGAFVVFESLAAQLAVVGSAPVTLPFVVGADLTARTAQILVDDATRPAVSVDGNHVAYQRDDAIRVLSSDGTSTVDVLIPELAIARPTSRLSISQFGRWIVFASRSDLSGGDLDRATSGEAPSVWAVDRRSSAADVVDTTSTTTTTPAVPTTTTATTVPATPSTLVPAVTVPRFPTTGSPFPSVVLRPFPRRAVSTATRPRPLDRSVGFDATAFASPVVFEPTVVAAGRRTAPVTLTNPTASAVRVTSVSVEGVDAFALVSDDCSGVVVASNGSCVVEVRFSPFTQGSAAGFATFQLLDGAVVNATLDGEGVAAPTLDLIPTVAGAGQTVTVFGAGFEGGSTVQLDQPGVTVSEPVVVDPDGTFAHVIVVLPNTPSGAATVMIAGQPDVFDDVISELLVSTRGSTSGDAALRVGSVGAFGR